MTLTQNQLALLPSDEDVAEFKRAGYYVSKTLFSEAEINGFLAASERFYSAEVDEPVVPVPDRFRPTGNYGQGLRKHDQSSMFSKGLRELVTHPILGAIASRLVGAPSIRLWHDQLLYKPMDTPGKQSNVGWHTDRGYWKTCTSANMVTAWVPFQECTEENGTITMVDGSHLWPDNTDGLNFFSNDLEGLEKNFKTGGAPVIKTAVHLLKGQVSFHHCLTIHGSGPNRTPNPRRSIAVHLQDEANRYQEFHYPDGRLARHDLDTLSRSVNGVPDYTDPDFCPVIWPLTR
jgi:ectoine hydroxylase-related dioxygenase (phytanoyl-CoA dioxygenase family)